MQCTFKKGKEKMKHIGIVIMICGVLFVVGCFSVGASASVRKEESPIDSFLAELENNQIKSIEVIPGDENYYRINFFMKFKKPVEPIAFWGSDYDKSDKLSLDGIVIFGRHGGADNEFRLVLDMRVVGVDKAPLKLYIGYDDEKNAKYRVEEFTIKINDSPESWEIEKTTGGVYDISYGE